MTPGQLNEVCKAAVARSTPEGIPWPISLTLNDGTYLRSVLGYRIRGKVREDGTMMRWFEGYDLERAEPVYVSIDDLTDARLLEGTWEYTPRQLRSMQSDKREKWLAKVTRNDMIMEDSPLGDRFPVRYLGLEAPGMEYGSMEEEVQMYDPPVGSIVLVEFEKNDRGTGKVLGLKVLKSSSQEG